MWPYLLRASLLSSTVSLMRINPLGLPSPRRTGSVGRRR
jgi:hypothetical protein